MYSKIITILFVSFFAKINAQSVNELTTSFTSICSKYKSDVFAENICTIIVPELITLESKVGESIFFNKALLPEEKIQLKNLKNDVIAIRHFISYQQACGSEYYIYSELQTASKILNATFEEVFVGMYCMKIYRTELNGFVSYLVNNDVNEHKKMNYKVKRIPYGVGVGESQIQAKGIKELYNNRTEKDIKTIEIVFLNCQ